MPPAGPQTGSIVRPPPIRRRAGRASVAVLALAVAAIAGSSPAHAQDEPDTLVVPIDTTSTEVFEESDTLVVPIDTTSTQVIIEPVRDEPDTLGVSFEIGGSTEVTTEEFFEDVFLDSVALGLRRVGTPESRFAGVWHATAAGTRGGRASAFRVENELSWGDRVRRDLLSLDWRRTGTSEWTWAATPRGEYRYDRTFGRDLEETRAAASARLRRSWEVVESAAELSGHGEWLRTHGTGADFVPDRNVAGVRLRFDREPLEGAEWQLGYGATARVFPDTSVRDHVEQRAEAAWRRDLAGGHRFELTGEFARRSTMHAAPTSLDRFREGELAVAVELSLGANWGAALRARGERLRYDERDTTVFFDYDLARLELEPRWSDGAWSVRLGPRLEWLTSPDNASDDYFEVGGAAEFEQVLAAWWSLSPSGGWREYASTLSLALVPGAQPVSASRSSFAFGQLDVMGDQPLPGRLRLRLIASGRIERHTDRAQDARSLYISLDLRRLF